MLSGMGILSRWLANMRFVAVVVVDLSSPKKSALLIMSLTSSSVFSLVFLGKWRPRRVVTNIVGSGA